MVISSFLARAGRMFVVSRSLLDYHAILRTGTGLETAKLCNGTDVLYRPHGGRQMFPPVDQGRLRAWLVLAS